MRRLPLAVIFPAVSIDATFARPQIRISLVGPVTVRIETQILCYGNAMSEAPLKNACLALTETECPMTVKAAAKFPWCESSNCVSFG